MYFRARLAKAVDAVRGYSRLDTDGKRVDGVPVSETLAHVKSVEVPRATVAVVNGALGAYMMAHGDPLGPVMLATAAARLPIAFMNPNPSHPVVVAAHRVALGVTATAPIAITGLGCDGFVRDALVVAPATYMALAIKSEFQRITHRASTQADPVIDAVEPEPQPEPVAPLRRPAPKRRG